MQMHLFFLECQPPKLQTCVIGRPIGIGVQGLADAFVLLGMPFDLIPLRSRAAADAIKFTAMLKEQKKKKKKTIRRRWHRWFAL
ncbi:hypothetical protein DY000_02020293 [Brassica cretica]|uniref:Uncharacterized protein n=1 Tax=Brassica cretica TaxID=69181 RepID=A0ABQ7E4P5_BRACR|nr:hypothetical protein DY000_02020293 [Brassica cretica]